MKRILLLALLAAGLASAAPAAVTAGLEVGYLTDNKDAIWSGRIGWQFASTVNLSHQVELEIGHTEHTEGLAPGSPYHFKTKLMPVTLNYRAETSAADKLGFYFGAGVGQTRVSYRLPGAGVPNVWDSDNAFSYQAFGGVTYKLTANASLRAGVKYIHVGDATVFSFAKVEVGDDLALTAGLDFKF
ncbi:MAG TPA: outer membrane beta-barrel protein [Lacunisphaera sp.]|nr:outer membrane beta-barrel protein [Lacunisphaera sp.]